MYTFQRSVKYGAEVRVEQENGFGFRFPEYSAVNIFGQYFLNASSDELSTLNSLLMMDGCYCL